MNTSLIRTFSRRARLILWAALVVWFACFARGTANTLTVTPPAPVPGNNGSLRDAINQANQDLQYKDGNLSEIDQKLADGTTIAERIDAMHNVTGVTFDAPGEKPQEIDIQPGPDIWSIPTFSTRAGDGPPATFKLKDGARWSNDSGPNVPSGTPTSSGLSRGYAFLIGKDRYANVIPSLAADGKSALDPSELIWSNLINSDLAIPKSIEIGGQTFPFGNGPFTFTPPATMGNFLPYELLDSGNKPVLFGLLPSTPTGYLTPGTFTPPPSLPSTFHIPQCVQAGKPIFVTGPFGDDFGVHVKFNGDPVDIQEQSGSAIMFTLPGDTFGTTNLHIDSGGIHIVAKVTSIGIKLISDDHILQPGDHDAFRCRVSGLDDLPAPVEVNIVDQEQNIVAMDAGAHVSFTIAPGSGSTISKDYGLTAVQKGAADIVAWVPQVWYDAYYTTDGQVAQNDTGTTTGTTTDTTGSTTGETAGGGTGETTGTTTRETTGGTTGSTTGTTTEGTTGDTTGSTTGTTGHTQGDTSQPGIAHEGWFEPVQGVWQDDDKFPDKPTKQIVQLSPTSWDAQLKMIVGRPTRLYGLRPDRHKFIVIKGETNRTVLVPVRFRFTLNQTGLPPQVIYIQPESTNQVYIDGPRGPIKKFDAELPAYDGIGKTDGTAFTIQNPGGYNIVADLIKPDGTSTGLSVTVSGEAVKTYPPKVYFLPMIWTDPVPPPKSKSTPAEYLKFDEEYITDHTKKLADSCEKIIPLWYPVTPDGFHTKVMDLRDYREDMKRIDGKWTIWDVTTASNRTDRVMAELTRILSQQAYQEKAGRIVCVLDLDEFQALMDGAAAFTASQKVIFIPYYVSAETIAHEYIHTTPFLWSSDEMESDFGFSYHNGDDHNYGDGAEIHMDGEEHRKTQKAAIMGAANDIDKKWITQGSYWHLINELLAPHDPPVTCVTAYLKNDNGNVDAMICPLYQMMGEVDTPAQTGDWSIVARDAAGNVQYKLAFDPHWQLADTDRPNVYRAIVYRIPYMPTTTQIDIAGPGGKILDSRKISQSAPDVEIASPVDGGSLNAHDNKVTVTWTGTDPGGAPLLYSVLYSPNDGEDWYSEAFEIKGTTAEIPLENGADKPRVKVIATNGSRSSEAEVGFSVH